MSENTTKEEGQFETLEDRIPAHGAEEHLSGLHTDEYRFEFLIQDMFLDHFFP